MNNTSAKSHPAANLGCAQRPQTQVEALLNELNGAIDSLDKSIAVHSEKLGPVLRPVSPEPCCDKAVPEELLVERADFLRRMLRRIRGLDACVSSLTERTEA